ncbi:hypothetical protein GUITHDRAFT_116171 [Guillardia theta CCMP2712]|uniref:Uncharacterized protein n=1 Tax=Guillardia theta (strain CCMP2712) TaxID=905079 RepID=L1IPF2_GUITC|nr:hypothetical protein GUITHDRAFT_116171 [Guillardia theta CCMP2712]EKX37695.1 hypothetical protein GUITHDRAFT_116171 [Guillardia theta CCMP2712]|eukprot:XP_005824675.1 hypothetical protein GUITHDRAFT_116171 [Guillardia theta CCMP2712]
MGKGGGYEVTITGINRMEKARSARPTDLRATLSSTPHVKDLRSMLSNRSNQPPAQPAADQSQQTKQLFSRKRRNEELQANEAPPPTPQANPVEEPKADSPLTQARMKIRDLRQQLDDLKQQRVAVEAKLAGLKKSEMHAETKATLLKEISQMKEEIKKARKVYIREVSITNDWITQESTDVANQKSDLETMTQQLQREVDKRSDERESLIADLRSANEERCGWRRKKKRIVRERLTLRAGSNSIGCSSAITSTAASPMDETSPPLGTRLGENVCACRADQILQAQSVTRLYSSPRESSKDLPRDSRASSREISRDIPKDTSRDIQRDGSRRDSYREMPREFPRESTRDSQRDIPRDTSRDILRDTSRDIPRDTARDIARDRPRESTRDMRDERKEDRRSTYDDGRSRKRESSSHGGYRRQDRGREDRGEWSVLH